MTTYLIPHREITARSFGGRSPYPISVIVGDEWLHPDGSVERVSDTISATVISIPAQPAYSLSPNSRKHWRVKHRETNDAKFAAYQSRHGVEPVHGPVVLTWTVYKAKGRRTMDRDNLIPCLKPFMDGLVECGIIDGDTPDIVTAIHVEQVSYQDHGGPLGEIEVRIQPVQEAQQ